MPPVVYQRLVELGKLTVSDLERFAAWERCVDAQRALVRLVEEGDKATAKAAAAALRRVQAELENGREATEGRAGDL